MHRDFYPKAQGDIPAETTEHPRHYKAPRVELAVELITSVGELAEGLSNERPADKSLHSFYFDGDKLSSAVVPDDIAHLREYAGQLNTIRFDVEANCDYPSTAVSVVFELTGEDGTEYVVHCRRPGYATADGNSHDHMTTTSVSGEVVETALRQVDYSQLNRLFASLCFPIKDGDYSLFDSFNLNDAKLHQALIDTLQKKASSFEANIHYDFNVDAGKNGSVSYQIDDGEIVSCYVRDVRHSGVAIVDGQPSFYEKVLETNFVIDESGFEVRFSLSTTASDVEKTEPLQADVPEYEDVVAFLKFQYQRLASSALVQPEGLHIASAEYPEQT